MSDPLSKVSLAEAPREGPEKLPGTFLARLHRKPVRHAAHEALKLLAPLVVLQDLALLRGRGAKR